MKVVITGASGFIGRNLLADLPGDWHALAMYHHREDLRAFVARLGNARIQPASCDLGDVESIERFTLEFGSKFDACIYLAANGDPALSSTEPARDLRDNALGLVNFLSAVRFKRFLYFSSGAVYEGLRGLVSPATAIEPVLPYAISKSAGERYVRFFAQRGDLGQYLIVRFFGAYGPYEPKRKIYSRLVEAFAIKKQKSFRVRGDGKNLIDAMFVSDATSAIVRMLRADHWDMTIDLCSGNSISIDELIRTAAEVFGVGSAVIEHEGTVPEYIKFWASPDQMGKAFDFRPRVSLQEGLRRLAEYLSAQGVEEGR